MEKNTNYKFKIVISGSFKKYYDHIKVKITEFENLGIQVLSPKYSTIINPEDDFVILKTDNGRNPKDIEKQHLEAIYNADALYIYNHNGYIGPTAAMELGWALGFGKPIYLKEACEELVFKNLCNNVSSPQKILNNLVDREKKGYKTVNRYSSLEQLQKYIKKMVIKRGFDNETTIQILLLMVEEIGELAKAIRKNVGLKIDDNNKENYPEIEYELADVFIYLLDLANSCNVDLFSAFYKKEKKNVKRFWSKDLQQSK